jgi:BirA family biotin operon repressor/biotin-[acetyl-CoA-carboxylase] ligase
MRNLEIENLAGRLLAVIRKKPGNRFHLADLAKKLKAQPAEIDHAVKTLASWHYKLKKGRESVVFVEAPDLLTDIEIRHNLKTKAMGRHVYAHRSVKSTNDIAAKLAESGAADGSIVVSEEQTKGRGRLGRQWHSPPGVGIYVSIILRPDFGPQKAPAISIMTAVALADTFSLHCPGQVRIKWPNDVLLSGKKAAGILTELSAEKGQVNHIIIGVGMNVNQRSGDLPAELLRTATSLRRVLKHKVRRVDLLQSFLVNLEKEYRSYRKYSLKKSHARIRRYSSLIGRTVKLRTGRQITRGTAVDIDINGCLIVELDGVRKAVTAGQVTVVKG